VLARQIGRLRTGLVLAQHPDNLFFRIPPGWLSITHISGHAEFKTDLDIC
jgi:hypothetical protein